MDNQLATVTGSVSWRPVDVIGARSALEQLDVLRAVAPGELTRIARLCTLRAYEPGAALMVERAVPYTLFIIVQGSVSVTAGECDDRPVLINLLGRGDLCGEGGLFGMRFRRLTARAENRVYALQIRYAELQSLLPELPTFHQLLRQLFRERLLQTTLVRVPLLNSLNALERLALTDDINVQQVDRGATITELGEDGQSIGIIAEGQAQLLHEDQAVGVLGPGDVFGEIVPVSDGQPLLTVTALTPLHLLTIPMTAFRQLLQEHPEVAAGLEALVNRRYAAAQNPEQQQIVAGGLQSGLVRGRRALARIPALCPPGCDLCERACSTRHGAPRIRLNGLQLGTADVLTGCKHCVWTPECVEACPANALEYTPEGLLHVNDRCTGCGACAEACPYEAITMIPLYPAVSGPLDWLMRRVRQPPMLRLHANKCDSCHGYADQACMTACPTGSLRWIGVDEIVDRG